MAYDGKPWTGPMDRVWVICPVVIDRGCRKPKVSIMADPGIPSFQAKRHKKDSPIRELEEYTERKTYRHASCIVNDKDWCLSNVRGVDLSTLYNDPEITVLTDPNQDLGKTPRELKWNNARVEKARGALRNKGARLDELNEDKPFWEWIREVGKKVRPNFPGPRGTWVM